jgi:hypothetical protein
MTSRNFDTSIESNELCLVWEDLRQALSFAHVLVSSKNEGIVNKNENK